MTSAEVQAKQTAIDDVYDFVGREINQIEFQDGECSFVMAHGDQNAKNGFKEQMAAQLRNLDKESNKIGPLTGWAKGLNDRADTYSKAGPRHDVQEASLHLVLGTSSLKDAISNLGFQTIDFQSFKCSSGESLTKAEHQWEFAHTEDADGFAALHHALKG